MLKNLKKTTNSPIAIIAILSLILSFFFTSKTYAQVIAPEFTDGVNITVYSDYFNVKVDRNLLPDSMKAFTKISVCGVDDVTDDMINYVINDTIINGHGLEQYDEINGFNESNKSPYNLIILFDDSMNPLGYYIYKSSDTPDQLPLNVPQFTKGVIITINEINNDYIDFNVKIDRNLLPDSMREFMKIAVCGVDNVSDDTINYVINDSMTNEHGLMTYDEINGFNERNGSPYNLIMLFDDSKNPLGYYIYQSGANAETLAQLLSRLNDEGMFKNKGIYNSLYTKVSKGNIEPFINEVKAQAGKGINQQAANMLLNYAAKMNLK